MKKWIFSCLCTSLSLCAANFVEVEDKCDLKILTPSLEMRKTAKIRLENGLEAYLISDPGVHESGAALAVHVGSWDDPEDAPGLAHFVEHMLFMGTEKYPDEKEYHRFLDEHGGRNNAFTCNDRTVFMFSVANDAFEPTIDRFSQFFISPLFNISCLQRECHAVDQEFSKNIPLDVWRLLHVKKEIANPGHPFHRFSIGNCTTLGHIPQERVKAWYDSHYSANLMHLAVISPLPLKELEELVATTFSKIENKDLQPSHFEASLFPSEISSKLLVVHPKQQLQKLEISWELPPTIVQEKQVKAATLLKYVLSHEGESTLFSKLKKEGLASSISSHLDHLGYGQGVFNLGIQLTSKGVEEVDTVIALCMEALESYKESGIPSYFFDEIKEIETLAYSYQMREETFDFVTELAYCLIDEPLETFPKMTLMPTKFDPKKVSDLIALLTPEKAHFTLIASEQASKRKAEKKEEWLGVPYSLLPLELKKSEISDKKEIGLPIPNPFIPSNLKLVTEKKGEQTSLIPKVQLIGENAHGKAYYASDDRFFVPLVASQFSFYTPLIHEDNPSSKVLADLYARNFEKKMQEISYQAELAGLHYTLVPFTGGLQLTLKGYSEKSLDFFHTLLKELASFKPTKADFLLHKEELIRDYHNSSTKTPVIEAKEMISSVLYKDFVGNHEKWSTLKDVDYGDFAHFVSHLWKKGYVEATFFGNLTEETAKKLFLSSQEILAFAPFPPSEHYHKQIALFSDLEDPSYIVKKSKLEGNALILVMDAGEYSPQAKASLEILAKGLEEPFFTELRTRQQTAYLVSNWEQEIEGHLYAFFMIQSSSHATRDLLARFELFFENVLSELENEVIPPARFESIRLSSIDCLKNCCDNAYDTAKILHTLAFEKEGNFEFLDHRIKGLAELGYDDFKKFAHQLLGKTNHKRVAVCVDGLIDKKKNLSYHRHSNSKKIRKEFSYKGRNETYISGR